MTQVGVGKLPPDVLEREVLGFRGASRSDVIAGPGIGEDAALIDFAGAHGTTSPLLTVSSDPIVGANEGAGRLLVHINANDIACKGGEPLWFVATLIVPAKDGVARVRDIMREIHEECAALGVAVVGGHTELTDRYEQPVLVGTMLGKTDFRLCASDIRAGDSILMTRHAGIEGMSIIVADRPDLVSFLSEEEKEEVRSWSKNLSILQASRAIRDIARFMHDPTEGGVMGGLFEFSKMSALKIEIDEDRAIPVHPITKKVSEKIGFDPLRLISSGVLLAAVAPASVEKAIERLKNENIEASIIGRMNNSEKNENMDTHEELWRILRR